jgi:hypothetical protein
LNGSEAKLETMPPATGAPGLFAAIGSCIAAAAGLAVILTPAMRSALGGWAEAPLGTWLLAGSAIANLGLAALALNRHRRFQRIRAQERSFRDLYENISEGGACSAPRSTAG